LAFYRDHCGFTFGDVETVEDCILELTRSFSSNAGIEDWREYSLDNVKLVFTKLRRENGPSALVTELSKPLAAAASFAVALEEEHFCTEPVDAVVPTEEDVRATTPADDLEAAEIGAPARSVQPDIDARSVTKPVPKTTVLLVDNVPHSTVKTPIHTSPPRRCRPSSCVFQPDKLTNRDKSGSCLISLEARSSTFWLQKEKEKGE
jgi:hypothetical protein